MKSLLLVVSAVLSLGLITPAMAQDLYTIEDIQNGMIERKTELDFVYSAPEVHAEVLKVMNLSTESNVYGFSSIEKDAHDMTAEELDGYLKGTFKPIEDGVSRIYYRLFFMNVNDILGSDEEGKETFQRVIKYCSVSVRIKVLAEFQFEIEKFGKLECAAE